MKTLVRCLVMVLGAITISTLSIAQWLQTNGPYGGAGIWNLTASGNDIYACSYGKIHLSTNFGNSWTSVSSGLPQSNIFTLAVCDTIIFAGCGYSGGVYRSTNKGSKWSPMSSGLPRNFNRQGYLDIGSFAVSSNGAGGHNIFAGIEDYQNGGVFLTTNYGETWTEARNGLPLFNLNYQGVKSLAVISNGTGGSFLFAATDNNGIFRSTDNGTSWSAVYSERNVYALAVSDNGIAGAKLFAGGDDRIVMSTNNGNNWTNIFSLSGIVRSLIVSDTTIFAGTAIWNANSSSYEPGSTYRSTDNGSNWTTVNVTNDEVNSFALIPMRGTNTNIFAGSYNGGVFRSTNNGKIWNVVNNGLGYVNVKSFVSSPNGSGESNLFAGTERNGFFFSTDYGNVWTLPNNNLLNVSFNTLCVLSEANANDQIFAGIGMEYSPSFNGGVILSTDHGASWSSVNNGLPKWDNDNYKAVTTLISDSTNLFALTGDGVYRSTDNGGRWDSIHSDLPNKNVTSLTLSQNGASGKNLFAGIVGYDTGWYFYGGWVDGGVYRSTNNGDSWIKADSGLTNKDVLSLAVSTNGTETSVLFAGTVDGVFVSTNNGAIWTKTSFNYGTVRSFAVRGSDVFAVTWENGVFLTFNNGRTWRPVNSSPANSQTNMLQISGAILYAGTSNGVWQSNLADIVPPHILTLTQPAGSETWIAGSTRTITWSPGNTDTIRIDYSVNDGQSWNLIADTISVDPPVYTWLVPLFETPKCRIRIQDTRNTLVNSISKDRFSITTSDLSDKLVRVSETSIAKYVRALEAFGIRKASHPNHGAIANYIRSCFAESGITDVVVDSFLVSGIWQKNVIATIPGSGPSGQELVVGGHFDTESSDNFFAPGADDNASGTAAVIEIASAVKQSGYRPKTTMKFVTFAAEELGRFGSKDYVAKAKAAGRQIMLMQNYDMIGYHIKSQPERTVKLIWYYGSEKEASLDSLMKCCYTTIIPIKSSTYDDRIENDGWVFYNAGYKTVFNKEWTSSPYYHTTKDLSHLLDFSYAAEIVRSGLALLLTMDASIPTDVGSTLAPVSWTLKQNYPNPFNPSTSIRYALPSSANVKLTIHDILGREIATLVNEEQSAGWKEVVWNASLFSSGIYFYKLEAGGFTEVKKLMLLK